MFDATRPCFCTCASMLRRVRGVLEWEARSRAAVKLALDSGCEKFKVVSSKLQDRRDSLNEQRLTFGTLQREANATKSFPDSLRAHTAYPRGANILSTRSYPYLRRPRNGVGALDNHFPKRSLLYCTLTCGIASQGFTAFESPSMIKVSSQLFPPALVKTQVECRKLNENKLEIRTTRRAVLHDCFAPTE
jgi:hypothetical protein